MIEVVKYSQIHDKHPIVELRRAHDWDGKIQHFVKIDGILVATLPLGKPVQIGHPLTALYILSNRW